MLFMTHQPSDQKSVLRMTATHDADHMVDVTLASSCSAIFRGGRRSSSRYVLSSLLCYHHSHMLIIVTYLCVARPWSWTWTRCDGLVSKESTVGDVHGPPAPVQVEEPDDTDTAAGESPQPRHAAGVGCRRRQPKLVFCVVRAFFPCALHEGGGEGVCCGCGGVDGAAASALPAAASGRAHWRWWERNGRGAAERGDKAGEIALGESRAALPRERHHGSGCGGARRRGRGRRRGQGGGGGGHRGRGGRGGGAAVSPARGG
ncbi:hypothetical protein D1007_58152 [Hordeum vulgare]|nr:hypothetical protein D1007_58152 [Hordeum vulgare]